MNKQLSEVLRRRGELIANIASQREQAAELGARWQAPLTLADRGYEAVRLVRAHPVLVAGVAALFVVRRSGTLGLLKAGWRVWKGYRFFIALSEKITTQTDKR